LWAAAVAAVPLLPLLGWAVSQADAPQAPIRVMPVYRSPAPAPAVSAAPMLAETPAETLLAEHPEEAKAPSLLDYPWALALAAYAAGATTLLALVGVGRLRLGRWARTGRRISRGRVPAAFRAAAARFSVNKPVTIVESRHVASPLTIGTLRPVVLLPAGFASATSDEELLAIAIHEMVHVRRCDALILGWLSVVRAALFLHPLIWLACRQVASLAEAACDDAVLEATGEPVGYAKMLVRMAEAMPHRALATELAAGFLLSKGSLLRRVEAILSDRREQIRRLSRVALGVTLLAGAASVALALALPLAERDSGAEETAASPAPVDTSDKRAAPPPLAVAPDGAVGLRFGAGDLAGVFLTRYAKTSPAPVPPSLWPSFVEAVASARRRPDDITLSISQGAGIVFVLADGRQVYVVGEGEDWSLREGANVPCFVTCEPLGQAVAAARKAGKATNETAVPALVAALRRAGADAVTRALAAEFLGKLGDAAAVGPLAAALKDTDTRVCRPAAEALATLRGPGTPKQAVDVLVEALADSDASERYRAAKALARVGPRSEAVTTLTRTLDDPQWFVQSAAAEALGRAGPSAREALPALEKLLTHKNGGVRAAAGRALEQIRGAAAPGGAVDGALMDAARAASTSGRPSGFSAS
ncbi:MAG: M56 family metallopeptidase, partial [Planctomycetota bacterium]|nr:M56 family metallopeptidase [Planctomycetota bacterium]